MIDRCIGKCDENGITDRNAELQNNIPINITESKLSDKMHTNIWCSCSIPSFKKFCEVVSEKLQ